MMVVSSQYSLGHFQIKEHNMYICTHTGRGLTVPCRNRLTIGEGEPIIKHLSPSPQRKQRHSSTKRRRHRLPLQRWLRAILNDVFFDDETDPQIPSDIFSDDSSEP